jgi:hypothetical protein
VRTLALSDEVAEFLWREVLAHAQPRLFLPGQVAPAGRVVEHRLGSTQVVNVFDHQLLDLGCTAISSDRT